MFPKCFQTSFTERSCAGFSSLSTSLKQNQSAYGPPCGSAAKDTSVKLVCYGASAAGLAGVKSGAWFSDVAQAPASEGQLGMIALVKAMKTGRNSGSQNPVASLPDHGILTKSTVSKFTAQWQG